MKHSLVHLQDHFPAYTQRQYQSAVSTLIYQELSFQVHSLPMLLFHLKHSYSSQKIGFAFQANYLLNFSSADFAQRVLMPSMLGIKHF